MKTLLIDLGNTRWKMATAQGRGIGKVASGVHADGGDLGRRLRPQMDAVEQVYLASVADRQITDAVQKRLDADLAVPVRRVHSTDPMPNVKTGYRQPEQLGVDRLLAMVGARAQHQAPLCVIDAGTAVTIDFIDAAGQHLGGFILPGVGLSRACLLRHTAIPSEGTVDEHSRLGRDTATAVALGCRQAVAGLVERFLQGSQTLFERDSAVTLLTGGDADQLFDLLPGRCRKVEDLVLRGLAALVEAEGR